MMPQPDLFHPPRVRRLLTAVAAASLLAVPALAAPLTPRVLADDGCRPLVRVDAPARDGTVRGAVTIRGWASDYAATPDHGTGVTAVSITLDATADAPGTALGQATYGAERPDVAGLLGEQFRASGFSLNWDGAAPLGPHTLSVTATTACGTETTTVPFTLAAPDPNAAAAPATTPATAAAPAPVAPAAPACSAILTVDPPGGGAVASAGVFTLYGWAVDPASTGTGTGVSDISVYAGADATGTLIATTQPSMARTDVQTSLGLTDARFGNSGFSVQVPAMSLNATGGKATVTVIGQSACGPITSSVTLDVGATTSAGTIGGVEELLPPGNPRLVSFTDGVASLAWDPSPSARVTGYVVQLSKDGAGFSTAQTLPATATSAQITGLTTGSRYEFNVYTQRNTDMSRTAGIISTAPPSNPAAPFAQAGGAAAPPQLAPNAGNGFFGLPGANGNAPPSTASPAPASNPTSTSGGSSSVNYNPTTTGGQPNGVFGANGSLPIPGSQGTGTYPNCVNPTGSYPNGTYPSGAYPNGTYPNGTYPNGTYPNGSYQNCNYANGSYPTNPYGSTATGSLPAPSVSNAMQVQGGYGSSRAVQVNFGQVPGASGYTLFRATGPNAGWSQVTSTATGAATLTDTAVPGPGTYYYAVVANGVNGGSSQASNVVSVTVY